MGKYQDSLRDSMDSIDREIYKIKKDIHMNEQNNIENFVWKK